MIQLRDFKNDYTGLTEEKAMENIKLYGYNSDTKLDEKEKGFSPAAVFFRARFLLLLAAAALSFVYGGIITGGVLSGLLVIYAAAEIFKGKKCDEYFFELKRASRVHYNVVREGEQRLIRKEHIVPDDIILLEAGESVPADAHLLEISTLTVDESIFTGDKRPVDKITGADSLNEGLKTSCVYKGTKIVTGRLIARVTGTGVDTKLFKTFGAPHETDEYFTAFEKTVRRVSGILDLVAAVMLAFCALFSFTKINIYSEHPVLDTVYYTLYPAVAFALCFVPCEAASLVRVYYILGARALAKKNVTIRDIKSMEKMSAVTCMCVDKSGMITGSRMELADVVTKNDEMMTNISVLSCSRGDKPDSADQAIILGAAFRGADVKELQENELLREYPYDPNEVAMGNLWEVNGTRLMCVKGVPDRLLPLCDVPSDMLYTVQNKIQTYEKQGRLVNVVAFAQLKEDDKIPEKTDDIRYGFMGLLAFENKTRDNAPFAVRSCYKAGINVVMMTDDTPETAAAIARRVGIRGEEIITGDQLRAADESGVKPDLSDVGVFARITPEQRPGIIRLLQESGEIVAACGDGNTDSDLFEQADLAVALAGTGSGAAGEAVSLTVPDDNFDSVTDALRMARQTYANAKRCVCVHLTAAVTLAVFGLINLLLGTQFILSPVLLGIIGIIIIPGISLMFVENNTDYKDEEYPSVFLGTGKTRKRFFLRPFVQAFGLSAAEVIFYLISSGYGVNSADTVTGLALQCASNFLFILIAGLLISGWINMSEKSAIDGLRSGQSFAGIISGIAVLAALLLVYIPYVNSAVGLSSVSPFMPLIILLITLVSQIPSAFTKGR